MTQPPPWRRLDPGSLAARLWLCAAVFMMLSAVLLLAALPLASTVERAQDRAALLDERTAALGKAIAARKAETQVEGPAPDTLRAATEWLDETAPIRNENAAMLDLVSTIRLIADTTEVTLVSAAPQENHGSDPSYAALLSRESGTLTLSLSEARITADHTGLARFLSALETIRPTLFVTTLDISAASSRADAEADRLTARITIAALSRSAE